ncbi:catalase family protein [Belnapia sp. T6]|uniref:Catalase family protein n=1 Tax=Belnapia mucosa TaxID=2804532 RepID=A0ABS1V1P7_9PROT|nr:catalase family protein [Belnapia mucosa]MBL6455628.1 catalase family protein [Belnapia mucosa]
MPSPVLYQPGFEQPAPDEDATIAALMETMRGISETTWKDGGHALRSVHAKSHGLLQGELEVLEGLPPELAQGAFARPARYPAVLRFSTVPGDILDDSVSAPRGLALKLIGVEGERLPGAEGSTTQDFVMVDAPAFAAPDPKAFLANLKLLAKTTDTPQGWKKALSAVLRGAEAVAEGVGHKSPLLTTLGGHPLTHVLGETYYTQAPLLHGPYMAKLSLAPVSEGLLALVGRKVAVGGKPDALREAVVEYFATHGGEWELRVQLCTDIAAMPIEDASVAWPEEQSPYRAVARLSVPAQPAWTPRRSAAVDDGMAFSPWNGLAAHRPIGGVMRARRPAYAMSSAFRGERNGCPMHEPAALEPGRLAS